MVKSTGSLRRDYGENSRKTPSPAEPRSAKQNLNKRPPHSLLRTPLRIKTFPWRASGRVARAPRMVTLGRSKVDLPQKSHGIFTEFSRRCPPTFEYLGGVKPLGTSCYFWEGSSLCCMADIWSDWPVICVWGCVLLFALLLCCSVALLCYVSFTMRPPQEKQLRPAKSLEDPQ